MAVQMTVSDTDKRDGKALALFARCAEWQTGHTKDGRSFFAIPGREADLFHMVDQNDCSCPDRQRCRNVCKHMRAVRLWMAAYKTGALAPKPRPATAGVVDDARRGDDLAVLLPAGAAYLVEQTTACPSYADLFHACAGGCGDLVEKRGQKCYACLSNETRRLEMASKRVAVGV